MEKQLIDRINQLAKKSRAQGLSEAEKAEQAELRARYLREFRAGFAAQLENTVVQRPDGTRQPLRKKGR